MRIYKSSSKLTWLLFILFYDVVLNITRYRVAQRKLDKGGLSDSGVDIK